MATTPPQGLAVTAKHKFLQIASLDGSIHYHTTSTFTFTPNLLPPHSHSTCANERGVSWNAVKGERKTPSREAAAACGPVRIKQPIRIYKDKQPFEETQAQGSSSLPEAIRTGALLLSQAMAIATVMMVGACLLRDKVAYIYITTYRHALVRSAFCIDNSRTYTDLLLANR
eukprot:1161966-Pelagomonas_calceolata.AAC.14